MHRAVRFIRYYGEQEGYGGLDMIAGVGWSAGSGRIKGVVNNLYGTLNASVYCSDYVPDEFDEISADFDVVMLLYGPGELNPENPNWPAQADEFMQANLGHSGVYAAMHAE